VCIRWQLPHLRKTRAATGGIRRQCYGEISLAVFFVPICAQMKRLLADRQPWYGMPSYERLKAWQLAYQLDLTLYHVTDGFPRDERFGLTSQIRRAAFSVVANIAEGAAKRGRREFRRFLDIALGSITEIEVALRIARDRQYIPRERWTEVERQRNHAGVVLWKLYAAMKD